MSTGLISVKCFLFQVALGVHPCQAFSMETAITFQLVVCVLATSRSKSAFHLLGPVVVGLSVILGNLVAVRKMPDPICVSLNSV